MSEIEIIKLVFGIFLSIGGFVLIILAFKLFYKYLIMEKRCTSKTEGIVKRYTMASYSGVHLPIVYYEACGKEYKIKGPEYKWVIEKTVSTPFSKNEVEYKEEDGNLRINRSLNSFGGVYKNPIQELYPVNSRLDVFYDPDNPQIAYVLRYSNKKSFFWLMFISGILTLIIDLLILICLWINFKFY